jgi:DNA helicase-2/ATP-dependent DNA helicase PcrA
MDYTPWQALVLLHNLNQDKTETPPPRPSPFGLRSTRNLVAFTKIMLLLIAAKEKMPLTDLFDLTLARTGYKDHLKDEKDEGESRWENLQELKSVAQPYDDLSGAEALAAFLEEIALVSDVDGLNEHEAGPALLTLHAAKGLEFPVVFMVGMENGLFPHARSKDNLEEMEEERRLAYVGVTRAKDRLYLTHAFRRAIYGRNEEVATPSPFLSYIPANLIEVHTEQAVQGGSYRSTSTLERHRRSEQPARSYRNQTSWRSASSPTKATSTQATAQFEMGDKVKHKVFGKGTVISVKNQDGDEEVTVAFPGKGVKRLLTSLAPLEKLN